MPSKKRKVANRLWGKGRKASEDNCIRNFIQWTGSTRGQLNLAFSSSACLVFDNISEIISDLKPHSMIIKIIEFHRKQLKCQHGAKQIFIPLSTMMGSEKKPQTRHRNTASLSSGIIELDLIIIPLIDTIFSISARKEKPRITLDNIHENASSDIKKGNEIT